MISILLEFSVAGLKSYAVFMFLCSNTISSETDWQFEIYLIFHANIQISFGLIIELVAGVVPPTFLS